MILAITKTYATAAGKQAKTLSCYIATKYLQG
jgi:hypothetical protein